MIEIKLHLGRTTLRVGFTCGRRHFILFKVVLVSGNLFRIKSKFLFINEKENRKVAVVKNGRINLTSLFTHSKGKNRFDQNQNLKGACSSHSGAKSDFLLCEKFSFFLMAVIPTEILQNFVQTKTILSDGIFTLIFM